MNYVSTRDHNKTVTAAQAIAAGISSEGRLFGGGSKSGR